MTQEKIFCHLKKLYICIILALLSFYLLLNLNILPYDFSISNNTDQLPIIIFFKTHKTGSSSIQNILYRLALKHKKSILWGASDQTSSIRYPEFFDKRNVINEVGTAEIAANHVIPIDKNGSFEKFYQMFKTKTKNKKKTKIFKFTIIRHPLGLLKSNYNYWYNVKNPGACFRQSKTFNQFLTNYQNYSFKQFFDRNTDWGDFCQNSMSFDLGYDWEVEGNNNNERQIENIIENLDKELDLVLILERYWESVILLRVIGDLVFFFPLISDSNYVHLPIFKWLLQRTKLLPQPPSHQHLQHQLRRPKRLARLLKIQQSHTTGRLAFYHHADQGSVRQ